MFLCHFLLKYFWKSKSGPIKTMAINAIQPDSSSHSIIAPPAFNYSNDRNLHNESDSRLHTMNNRFKLGINGCWQSFPWPLFFNGTQTQMQRWGLFELINLTLGYSALVISLPRRYITGQMNFNHLLWRNCFSSRPSVTHCHFCRLHSGLNFPETLLSSVKCSNQRMIKS